MSTIEKKGIRIIICCDSNKIPNYHRPFWVQPEGVAGKICKGGI
jgi:hypothetical protein